MGAGYQRKRRLARPQGHDEIRRRRQQHAAGRHELSDLDQPGPRRPGFRAIQLAADDPGFGRDRPVRLRVSRAGRRRPQSLRERPALDLLRPACDRRGQPGAATKCYGDGLRRQIRHGRRSRLSRRSPEAELSSHHGRGHEGDDRGVLQKQHRPGTRWHCKSSTPRRMS